MGKSEIFEQGQQRANLARSSGSPSKQPVTHFLDQATRYPTPLCQLGQYLRVEDDIFLAFDNNHAVFPEQGFARVQTKGVGIVVIPQQLANRLGSP